MMHDYTYTPDNVPLIGARKARVREPAEAAVMPEGLKRELTGGEPILMRGVDDGRWLDIQLLPFRVKISGAE